MKLFGRTPSSVPSAPPSFWGEFTPCEHMVQLYQEEGAFLDTLQGFIVGGIRSGESVIVIATTAHLVALESRLRAAGIDVGAARNDDRYLTMDADETLATFMVDGWPDEELFRSTVYRLLDRARAGGRRVRAFGEMVALMWARGQSGATVRLEHLWHELCKRETFALLCAYPRSGFTQDAQASIDQICAAHSRVLPEAPHFSIV